jgi:hypothetical protein
MECELEPIPNPSKEALSEAQPQQRASIPLIDEEMTDLLLTINILIHAYLLLVVQEIGLHILCSICPKTYYCGYMTCNLDTVLYYTNSKTMIYFLRRIFSQQQ